jgi:hypothetical protein
VFALEGPPTSSSSGLPESLQGAFGAPSGEDFAKGRQLTCHLDSSENGISEDKIDQRRHVISRQSTYKTPIP